MVIIIIWRRRVWFGDSTAVLRVKMKMRVLAIRNKVMNRNGGDGDSLE